VISSVHSTLKDTSNVMVKNLISTEYILLSSLFDEHKLSVRIRTRQYFKISNLCSLCCFVFKIHLTTEQRSLVFRAHLRRVQNPRQTPDLNYNLQLNTTFCAMMTLK